MKIISLDFWGTVGLPNVEYGRLRTSFLSELFDIDYSDMAKIYSEFKRKSDTLCENFGKAVWPLEMMSRLMEGKKNTKDITAAEVLTVFEDLFILNHPYIDPRLIDVISDIVRCTSIRFIISSNTLMTPGRTIKSVIKNNRIPISNFIFSDEIGVSKPHKEFFSTLLIRANEIRYPTLPSSLVHIGDNPICDIQGSKKMGIQSILVKDPQHTIQVLEGIANEHTDCC